MKHYLTFLLLCFRLTGFAQPDLHPDTTMDYRQRFYEYGQLKTTNSVLYADGEGHFYKLADLDMWLNKYGQDTTGFVPVKHGLWVNFYDKKWNPADSFAYVYHSLTEYDRGFATGKIYYFKNRQPDHIILRYPPYHDSVFNGYRTTYLRKDGSVNRIRYERFIEDTVKGYYYNATWYYPNGKLRTYSLTDDFNYTNQHRQYDKKGFCFAESAYSGITGSNWCRIRRRHHGKTEMIHTHFNGKCTRKWYKNGKLVRSKEITHKKEPIG